MKDRGTGGKSNGTCRLCGLEKPLIKAHIIPRGLYEPIRKSSADGPASDAVPHLYKTDRGSKPLPRQSGIYDTKILCADCDGNACIGPFDRYGQGLLLSLDGAGREIRDTKRGLVAKQLSEFDYSMTKLFFMSILWRASITSQSFFDQVRLGPWETELRERLIKRDPGDEHCFSVIPFMYTGLFKEVMMNPSRERHDNVTFYRFRYPNGGFLVKVDKQKVPRNIRGAILSPHSPLFIRCIEYTSSSEYRLLQTMLPDLPP